MMTEIRDMQRLGFVGLGVMGVGQASNLVKKSGKSVLVYDRVPEAGQRMVDVGAEAAASLADLARQTDVIFLSLPGAPQVEAVVTGEGGLLEALRPGSVIVDLSTVPVDLVESISQRVREHGCHWVDAPVARTRQAAIDGTLSITVGCDAEVYDRVEPLLSTMASDVVRCGNNGAGALIKLVNNMVVFETVVALAEALTVVRRSGLVDPDLAWDALGQGSAASFVLENHGRKALLPDVHAEGLFPSEYMHKDLSYVLRLAEQLETHLPAASTVHELLGRTIEGGLGQAYHTAVVRVIEGAV